ncbi:unnamed protein product [Tenebrio molitor]|nr:unnamed protein product [Tenebrio molitor]
MIVGHVIVTIVPILVTGVAGFPVTSLENPKIPSTKVLTFLKNFGYIEEDDSTSGALYTEEGISGIIKTVQKFGALEQTGQLDNDTLALMSSPRCGVPDIIKNKRFKRYALGSKGWNKRTITYYIANWSPKLGKESVSKNIQLALDTWGKYGHLKFRKSNTPDADIIVAFGTGYHGDRFPFDGPGRILAHAFFPLGDQGFDGDIHFDADENWADVRHGGDLEGMDFSSVALHELGHSLGLSHSAVPNSVMFPYYQEFVPNSQLQLGYDDILGMYELYIQRNIEDDTYDRTTIRSDEDGTRRSDEDGTRRSDEDGTRRSDEDGTRHETSTTSTVLPYTTNHPTHVTETTTETFDSTTHSLLMDQTTSQVLYEGDSESVDDHKNHDPKHNIPATNSPSLPNICDGYFDAVASLREEIFIFKEYYVWRLKDMSKIEAGYPISIRHMFPDLPPTVKAIDAAYERPDGMIVLFTGPQFWVYDGTSFVENSPRPLSDYGLPTTLDKIDAVQVWGRNGKTYFYKQDHFWRYNEGNKEMDEGYPRHMERWRGVPHDLDAATTWKGVTHFFKGKLYWKFDNDWVVITEHSPLPTPQLWLGCPEDDTLLLLRDDY